ncbi:MAG: GAF domain-containing protein [Candidatus Binatia bacterium]
MTTPLIDQHEAIVDGALTFEEVLHQILNKGLGAVRATGGSLMLIDSRGEWLEIKARLGPPHPEREEGRKFKVGDGSIAGWVAKTGKAYLCPDVEGDPHFAPPRSGKLHFKSLLAVPIISGNTVVGVINADSEEPGFFTQDDKQRLSMLASQVSIPITERTRLLKVLDSLHEVGASLVRLSPAGRLADVLEKIAEQAVKVLQIDLVTLYEYDHNAKKFVVEGTGPTIAGVLLESGPMKTKIYKDDVPWKIVQEGESRFFPDAENDDFLIGVVRHPGEPERPRFVHREKITSSAALVLRVGDEIVGVVFANYRTPHEFSEDEKRILETFANYAAIAIQNARLYEQISQRMAQVRALNEVTRVIGSTLDLDTVLDLILKMGLELTEARQGTIHLVDSAARELVIRASRGLPVGRKSPRLEIGKHGITGWVAKNKRTVRVSDVTQEPWSNWYVEMVPDVRSELAVPLLSGDALVGVLDLESPELNAFDEDDVRLIEALASQAVIAIQNAEQYEQLQETWEALHEEQHRRLAAERLAILSQVAANFAHRMNNVAGTIPVAIQELKGRIDTEDKSLMRYLNRIEDDGRRLMEMAEQLRRPLEAGQLEWTDIHELLFDALGQAAIPEDVEVIQDYLEDLPTIRVIKSQLLEVFINLITNAVEAMMPDGGRLTIRSRLTKSNKWMEVEISDTGHGMTEEVQRRVFDLFFTTKKRRMGLGLWWCKTILQGLGGDISAKSRAGKGSTFTVRLPVQDLRPESIE